MITGIIAGLVGIIYWLFKRGQQKDGLLATIETKTKDVNLQQEEAKNAGMLSANEQERDHVNAIANDTQTKGETLTNEELANDLNSMYKPK